MKNKGAINILCNGEEGYHLKTVSGEFIEIAGIMCFKHFQKDAFNDRCTITNIETGFLISTGRSFAAAIRVAESRINSPGWEKALQKTRDFILKTEIKLPINNLA